MLKEELFRSLVTQEEEFWKEIEEAEEFTEEEVRGVVEQQERGWRWEGKVVFWRERIYVPDSATLWEEIITKHHDSELAGHPGYTKQMYRKSKRYSTLDREEINYNISLSGGVNHLRKGLGKIGKKWLKESLLS